MVGRGERGCGKGVGRGLVGSREGWEGGGGMGDRVGEGLGAEGWEGDFFVGG